MSISIVGPDVSTVTGQRSQLHGRLFRLALMALTMLFMVMGASHAASVSGRITTGDGVPLQGIDVALSGNVTGFTGANPAVTDSTGTYVFENVPTGRTYTVTPGKSGFAFAPASAAVPVNGAGDAPQADFSGRDTATLQGTLFYTVANSGANVRRLTYFYNPTTHSISYGGISGVTQLPSAQDLVFASNNDLFVATGSPSVYRVDPATGDFASPAIYDSTSYLSVAPDGDLIPDRIAYSGNQAFYVNGDDSGQGQFGFIDSSTGTRTVILPNLLNPTLQAARSIIFDPYSGNLILAGSNRVLQIDPSTHEIVSELNLSGNSQGLSFVDVTSDGVGHLFVSSSSGHMLFVDYTHTDPTARLVGDDSNFTNIQAVDTGLAYLAPLSGAGAGDNAPPSVQIGAPIVAGLEGAATTASATFSVAVQDSDNDVLTVEFFVDGAKIGDATTSIPANGPPTLGRTKFTHDYSAGSHSVTVRVSDGKTAVTASTSVVVGAGGVARNVAIVSNLMDSSDIATIRGNLDAMNLRGEVFGQENLTVEALSGFDLIIWDDNGYGEPGWYPVQDNTVNVLNSLYRAGKPLYFIGDDLASGASALSAPQQATWERLTRLASTTVSAFGQTVTLQNTGNPILTGPYGTVQGFDYPDVDRTTKLGLDLSETRLGTVHAYTETTYDNEGNPTEHFADSDVLVVAENSGGVRSFTQNVILYPQLSDNNITTQTTILFKNAVAYLLRLPAPGTTPGANNYWRDTTSDGQWNTDGNWSLGRKPIATDNVFILGGNPELTTNSSVASLYLAGTLRGVATVTVGSSMIWDGGELSAKVSLPASARLVLSGSDKYLSGGTITNAGATNWLQGDVRFSAGATFNNNGSFNVLTDADVLNGGGNVSNFNNKGTFSKLAVGATVNVFRGETSVSVPFNNQFIGTQGGTVKVERDAGSLNFAGGGTSGVSTASSLTPTFNVGAFSNLRFTNDYIVSNGTRFVGEGDVSLDGGTMTVDSNVRVGLGETPGNFVFNGGTLNRTGTGTLTVTSGSNFFWEKNGQLSTKIDILSGGNMEINGPDDRTMNSATITNSGTLAWNGTHRIYDSSVTAEASLIDNLGTFAIRGGGTTGYWGSGAITINNRTGATLNKSGGTTTLGGPFNNNNIVNVISGSLQVSAGGTNAIVGGGTGKACFNVSGSEASVDLASDYTLGDGTLLTGSGKTRVIGGTTTVSGTIAVGDAEDGGELVVNGGTLGGPLEGVVTVAANSDLTWASGDLHGLYTVNSAGDINIIGDAGRNLDGVKVNGNGTTNWSGTGQIYDPYPAGDYVRPTWTNNGIFNATAAAKWGYYGTNVFKNAGTFNKSTGVSTFVGVFDNTDTVNVTSGSLEINGGASGAEDGATFNAASSEARIKFTGGEYALNDGTAFVGAGRSVLSGGSASVNGAVTIGLPASDGVEAQNGNLEVENGSLAGVAEGNLTNLQGSQLLWSGYGSISGPFDVDSDGTILISGDASRTLGGGVTVNNDGTTNFDATGYIYDDSTMVKFNNDGTFNANATGQLGNYSLDFTNGGTLNVKQLAANTFNLMGDYTQTELGTLHIELGGVDSGTKYDLLNVTGTAKLDGTLAVSTINGYAPANGANFQIMNYAAEGRTGSFAEITGTELAGGLALQPKFNSDNLTLTVQNGASGILKLSSTAYTVDEGVEGGQATITVTRSNGTFGEVSVDYQTSNGTAAVGDDFTATSGTLVLGDGVASGQFAIPILNDPYDEADETLHITLSNAAGGASLGTPIDATLTITDNDDPSVIRISDAPVAPAKLLEGNTGQTTTAVFNVTLSAPTGHVTTVDYATADGTAIAGQDYTATSGTLTFQPGETSKTIEVSVIGDDVEDADETFLVNLSNPVHGTLNAPGETPSEEDSQGQAVIEDNDAIRSVRINDINVREGTGDTPSSANFTISLSAAASQTIKVDYATSNGTASSADYTASTGTVTFEPGDETKSISVPVIADAVDEANETFFVTLSNPVGAILNPLDGTSTDLRGTATILDDDAPPAVRISDAQATLTEGNTGQNVAANFTISLTGPTSRPVRVNYSTADGPAGLTGAVAGKDYFAKTGSVTFEPGGPLTQAISLTVVGDIIDESNELFLVNIEVPANSDGTKVATTVAPTSKPNLTDSQGRATIIDNDAAPVIRISDATATEADAGQPVVKTTFKVALASASGLPVTVKYGAVAGSFPDTLKALANKDFTAVAGTLTFAPGVTSQNVEVALVGDLLDENNEKFVVNLSAPTNGQLVAPVATPNLTDSQGIGTINDDDAMPVLTISDSSITEGAPGATALAKFTVKLSVVSGRPVVLNYATANGTAKAPDDYTAVPRTKLTFAPGETSKTVSVATKGDISNEGSETFFVNLTPSTNKSDPTYATIPKTNNTLADGQGVGTVKNRAVPFIRISDATGTEVNKTDPVAKVVFKVTLTAPSTVPVTVKYTTSNGLTFPEPLRAMASKDYTASSGTVTFAPGVVSQDVAISLVGDALDENNEKFLVNLAGATNAQLLAPGASETNSDSRGIATIADDDDLPKVTINDSTVTEGAPGTTVMAKFTIKLSAPSGRSVVVYYGTVNGTAKSPGDYTNVARTKLVFAPNETSKTVSVPVLGDTVVEEDETFFVNLSVSSDKAEPTYATIPATDNTLNDGQGKGTIVNRADAVSSDTNAAGAAPETVKPTREKSRIGLSAGSASDARDVITLLFTGAVNVYAATDASRYQVIVNGVPVALETVSCPSSNTVVLGLEEGALKAGDRIVVTYDLLDTRGHSIEGEAKLTAR